MNRTNRSPDSSRLPFGRRMTSLLDQARLNWQRMERFRRERERNKRYAFGDQWGDIITVDGKEMTEEQYLRDEGGVPLKNNFLNRMIRNVLGVYRSQSKQPSCIARDRTEQSLGETMSTVLQYNWQLNKMDEILSATMKEFLISGAAILRKSWGRRQGKTDCWTDMVNPRRFFVDGAMSDIRGWDVAMVGEIKDLTFGELTGEFARCRADASRLAEIYAGCGATSHGPDDFGKRRDAGFDEFLRPADAGRYRVVEVWTRERIPLYICHDRREATLYTIAESDFPAAVRQENAARRRRGEPEIEARWSVEEQWVYRCLAPDATVLRECPTPYLHGGHPYVFRFHPFIDGEVHSFVGDIIDQQRYINRLITLYDWTIRSSAKGVLLFPEECLPQGMTLEDVGREWARYNGILPVKCVPGRPMPQQISGTGANSGIHDLLSLQMKFIEEISGVNGALQGKPGYAGMSASLYSQQTQNSTMSLLDILATFSDFVVEGAYKDVKNIQQYYGPRRVRSISGSEFPTIYDPSAIANVEFDLAITETAATGAYRQLANDYLLQLWHAGAITAEQFIKYGEFPYSSQLLKELAAPQCSPNEPPVESTPDYTTDL